MMLRPGLELLSEQIGAGLPVRRHAYYRVTLRFWLADGQPVRWDQRWQFDDEHRVEEDGVLRVTEVQVHRGHLIAGLFHGMQGMNVGGVRLLRMAPHFAYGAAGIPGVIPPNAALTVEVSVLAERGA